MIHHRDNKTIVPGPRRQRRGENSQRRGFGNLPAAGTPVEEARKLRGPLRDGHDVHAVADLPEVAPRLVVVVGREGGNVSSDEEAVADVAALAEPVALVAVGVACAAVVAGVVVLLFLLMVAQGAEGDVRAREEDAPVVVSGHGVRDPGAGVRACGVVPGVAAWFAD